MGAIGSADFARPAGGASSTLPLAWSPIQPSNYIKALSERLRFLTLQLKRNPGSPETRRALNDALYEARHTKVTQTVPGEVIVAADHALAQARAQGPGWRATGRAQRPSAESTATQYSRVITFNLREAVQNYKRSPTPENYAQLNRWYAEARGVNATAVPLDVLKSARDTWVAAKDSNAIKNDGIRREPVEQWADLSSAPGASGNRADNYVGFDISRGRSGSTRVQARLRTRLELNAAGEWRVREIQAVGPHVSTNGATQSNESRVYSLRDAAGRPITDPARARTRALELLRFGGISAPAVDEARAAAAAAQAPAAATARGTRRSAKPTRPTAAAQRGSAPGAPPANTILDLPLPSGARSGVVASPAKDAVFLGLRLGSKSAPASNGSLTIPGTSIRLDKSFDLGALAVFFPGPKTVYVSSRKRVGPLYAVGTYNQPTNIWQWGVGTGKALGNGFGWFANLRVEPQVFVDKLEASRRNPGTHVVLGSANVGIIQSPECRAGVSASPANALQNFAPRVATGLGFHFPAVAINGNVYVKAPVGGPLVPVFALEIAMASATELVSNWHVLSCDINNGKAQLARLTQSVIRDLKESLQPAQMQAYGLTAAAMALAVAAGSFEAAKALVMSAFSPQLVGG